MTHTSTEQPDALLIAAWLRKSNEEAMAWRIDAASAIERLHGRVQELEAQTAHMADLVELADYATKKLETSQARVPLSDEQIEDLPVWKHFVGMLPAHWIEIARAIEAAYGITQEKQG